MKFPAAEAVIREELARDAQYALDLAAFLEGMADQFPEPREYGVTDARAGEIALLAWPVAS